MSRGQTLCSLMILAGIIWFAIIVYRQKKASQQASSK